MSLFIKGNDIDTTTILDSHCFNQCEFDSRLILQCNKNTAFKIKDQESYHKISIALTYDTFSSIQLLEQVMHFEGIDFIEVLDLYLSAIISRSSTRPLVHIFYKSKGIVISIVNQREPHIRIDSGINLNICFVWWNVKSITKHVIPDKNYILLRYLNTEDIGEFVLISSTPVSNIRRYQV